MRRLVRSIWQACRPRRTGGPSDDIAVRLHAADRAVGAALAVHDAAVAITAGDLLEAQEHTARGLIHDGNSPALWWLQGWCELALNRPAAAVIALDRCPHATVEHRLLALWARTRASQTDLAHLDLLDWARAGDMPPVARIMLAVLQLGRGDRDAARATLAHRALDHDPLACQFRAVLDVMRGEAIAESRHIADLLHTAPSTTLGPKMLATMSIRPADLPAGVPRELVHQLTSQLSRRPGLIPTLVVAQRCQPRPHRIELLRRAIVRLVRELENPMPAIEALAELAMLAGDRDEAARWCRRGLKLQPYSAKLALLLDESDEGRAESAGPRPLDVLKQAAAAQPNYPDVRRALILRYHRSGLRSLAERQARQWFDAQPGSELARRTLQELAA